MLRARLVLIVGAPRPGNDVLAQELATIDSPSELCYTANRTISPAGVCFSRMRPASGNMARTLECHVNPSAGLGTIAANLLTPEAHPLPVGWGSLR